MAVRLPTEPALSASSPVTLGVGRAPWASRSEIRPMSRVMGLVAEPSQLLILRPREPAGKSLRGWVTYPDATVGRSAANTGSAGRFFPFRAVGNGQENLLLARSIATRGGLCRMEQSRGYRVLGDPSCW